MYIVGLNLSHDQSACLLKDGEIRVAIALERLVRVKRGIIPTDQIGRGIYDMIYYCLDTEGISLDDVDYFVANTSETESDHDEHILLQAIGIIPRHKMMAMPHPSHHLGHAYASFYASGFAEAAALVVDAYGSIVGTGRESESAYVFAPPRPPAPVFKNLKPGIRVAANMRGDRLAMPPSLHGIGEMYRVMSLALGFRQKHTYYDEAGKTMGLAPYGRRLSQEPVLIRITDDGLDFSNAYPFLAAHNLISEERDGSYLNVRPESAPISQFHRDLAAQVQWEIEEACLHLARRLHASTGLDSIVLGGGTFLNSVTNHRILRESGFKNVYVFPASTDDGTAVGAAYYAYEQVRADGGARCQPRPPRHVFLGRTYASDQIQQAIEAHQVRFETLASEDDAADRAAQMLAEGKIIGWFQGGSELGPRALGNRSILANPCGPDVKDVVNSRVKFREQFRPFGPAVLQEEAHRYFDLSTAESPYMLLVCPVRSEFRTVLPGVTHVDGTARLQTVSERDNPLFYRLIDQFARRTGTPIVLNTSFNLRGLPIVETPEDALDCLIATQLDGLFMSRFAIAAPDFGAFVPVRNDLSISYRSSWRGADDTLMRCSPKTMQISVLYGHRATAVGDTVHVSPDELSLLETIDGHRSVREIATTMGRAVEALIPEILRLYRDDLIHWKHLSTMTAGWGQARAASIAVMPYQQA